MKILIMELSCHHEPYNAFMKASKDTWDSVEQPNVKTVYFYGGNEGRNGNDISVDCPEDYYMMHWKNKLALDAVWEDEWDIIFRTNSSSYVNKKRLYEFCENLPTEKLYGGWLLGDTLPYIEWEGHNIKQHCISGAGIFMSRDIADLIRKNTPPGENIEEDVLIGRTLYTMGYKVTFDDKSRVDLKKIEDYKPSYHYRIKSHNRNSDIELMYKLHERIKSEPTIGLLICTYNRPEYLRTTLESLSKAQNPNVKVLIVDDCSVDSETNKLLSSVNFEVVVNAERSSIRYSLMNGSDRLFELGCEVVINIDSDVLVRNDFITALMGLHKRFPENIITGFNCMTKSLDGTVRHPISEEGDGYNVKKSVGGVNMLYTKKTYDKYIKPALKKTLKETGNWDHEACKLSNNDGKGIICAVPSVIQHIGFNSSMGHTAIESADVADDFKSLSLPNVTLIGIDNYNPERLKEAIIKSTENIHFGEVIEITEVPIKSKEEYSEYVFRNIYKHIKTSHMLVVQHDGYVVNHKSWDKSWLKYDYIGAPWWYKDGMDVGNGGFSLRSKRLMEAVSKMTPKTTHPEDHVICRTLRNKLESEGFTFAPVEVASKFSVEGWNQPSARYTNQFGFHGNIFNRGISSKEKICVLQPFGLGDVIFSQTLVRSLGDCEIVWPVKDHFVEGLNRAYPKIKFVPEAECPIPTNTKEISIINGYKAIPIRYSREIRGVGYHRVMKAKYDMFGMDYRNWKQKAMWVRDANKENSLIKELGINESFNLINTTFGCDFKGNIDIDQNGIEMRVIDGYSLFDWAKVFESATEIHTVSSSILFLLDQLQTGNVHVYIRRPNENSHVNYDYIFTNPKFIYHL